MREAAGLLLAPPVGCWLHDTTRNMPRHLPWLTVCQCSIQPPRRHRLTVPSINCLAVIASSSLSQEDIANTHNIPHRPPTGDRWSCRVLCVCGNWTGLRVFCNTNDPLSQYPLPLAKHQRPRDSWPIDWLITSPEGVVSPECIQLLSVSDETFANARRGELHTPMARRCTAQHFTIPTFHHSMLESG
jgi:hypothetical protein